MVQARISGMISTDICQDCNSADIRLDSFILGNIADSGMITFGCVGYIQSQNAFDNLILIISLSPPLSLSLSL